MIGKAGSRAATTIRSRSSRCPWFCSTPVSTRTITPRTTPGIGSTTRRSRKSHASCTCRRGIWRTRQLARASCAATRRSRHRIHSLAWSDHMKATHLVLALVVGTILLSPSTATAQVSSGKVLGVVTDNSGGVLPGASIVVRNLGTGVTRDTVSNDRGQYEGLGVQPGRYQIDAEVSVFRRVSRGPIVIQVTQQTRLDIVLQLGEVAETITVQGTGTVVQTTTATIGKVVEEKQIVALPLTDRNFASLGLLTPGVTTRGQSTTDAQYVVHGQRQDANNFQLDGVANVTLGGNSVQARPNVDAVQEFKIQTSNFSAEFGRNAGSVVQVVTKSGTNELRGSTWEFVRNDKFQSPNFFTQGNPPPLRQNQFGGTVGGPVTVPGMYSGRNRSFFFGSYEGYRLTRGVTRQTVVATAQERAGNLSFLSKAIVDPLTRQPVLR